MTETEVFEKLKDIIVDRFAVEAESVKMESTFMEDLSADSLDIVELILNIEEEFDMEIPDSEAEKIVAVKDVVAYIVEHKK